MKTLFTMLITGVVVTAAQGQGWLVFDNNISGEVVAPVYEDPGWTTLLSTNYTASLYWASGVVSDPDALELYDFSDPNPNFPQFGIGGNDGYFFVLNPVDLTAATNTTITVQVRAWNNATGTSYEDSPERGESDPFTVDLSGTDPGNPAFMNGMQSFNVPEPSSVALALIGVACLLRMRRRP